MPEQWGVWEVKGWEGKVVEEGKGNREGKREKLEGDCCALVVGGVARWRVDGKGNREGKRKRNWKGTVVP